MTFLQSSVLLVAEKTFLNLRALAAFQSTIAFIAISRNPASSTAAWLEAIGGPGDVQVIVDGEREFYAKWAWGPLGFGMCSDQPDCGSLRDWDEKKESGIGGRRAVVAGR